METRSVSPDNTRVSLDVSVPKDIANVAKPTIYVNTSSPIYSAYPTSLYLIPATSPNYDNLRSKPATPVSTPCEDAIILETPGTTPAPTPRP